MTDAPSNAGRPGPADQFDAHTGLHDSTDSLANRTDPLDGHTDPLDGHTDPLDGRTRRARTESMTVRARGGGTYDVTAESGRDYVVDLPGGRCTCPDHRFRDVWCKHLRRVAREVAVGRVPRPGLAPVECAVCGRRVLAEEPVAPPHYCEHCDRSPGEFVVDRETGDLLVVAAGPRGRADEREVPGHGVMVAEYPGNEAYPDDDPVVEVMYPLPAGVEDGDVEARHLRRYAFPASRLRPAGGRS